MFLQEIVPTGDGGSYVIVAPMLRDTFDRVVVVNLARRPARMVRFKRQLADWPFKPPERFEAIDGTRVKVPDEWTKGPGAWGCMLSHRAVLASAIADGISSLLVLEDDACLAQEFAAGAAVFLSNVPNDWECLMLGGEHLLPPLEVGRGVVRCRAANRTHAFALRGRIMPYLLKCWHHYTTEHCDIILASVMRLFNVYAPDPFLIGQNAGFSDITETHEDVRFLPVERSRELMMS
jgi:hypothetical protein